MTASLPGYSGKSLVIKGVTDAAAAADSSWAAQAARPSMDAATPATAGQRICMISPPFVPRNLTPYTSGSATESERMNVALQRPLSAVDLNFNPPTFPVAQLRECAREFWGLEGEL